MQSGDIITGDTVEIDFTKKALPEMSTISTTKPGLISS